MKHETLCPSWDETLVLDEVELYGPLQTIVDTPPMIIVEIFDYDTVVSARLLLNDNSNVELGFYILVGSFFRQHIKD